MKPITYEDGQEVRVGDIVSVKSLFSKKEGKVVYVCDVNKPFGPNKNDYGISIQIGETKVLWGLPDKNTKLISRA